MSDLGQKPGFGKSVCYESWQSSGVDNRTGVFHYCDDSTVSWYEFADLIFSLAVQSGLLDSQPDVSPIPGSEFPQPAQRPKYSVLNTNRIERVFNINPVSFKQSLQTVVDEIKARK